MSKQTSKNSADLFLNRREIIYLMKLLDKDRKHLNWVRFSPTYFKLERHLHRILEREETQYEMLNKDGVSHIE